MTKEALTLQDLSDRIDSLANAALFNKQILNLEEAAVFIGVAMSYLYKLTSRQEIPHFKPRGKMIYFDRTELEAWLRQGRVDSIGDIQETSGTKKPA